jgi:uncharacterized protein
MNIFKINIAQLTEQGTIERTGEHYVCPAIEENARQQHLQVSFSATLAGSEVLVKGEIKGELLLDCCRCLEPSKYTVRIPIVQSFPSTTDEIDLEDEVRQLLILNLPTKPLCRQDCAGLCPQCGINRNTGTCQCSDKPAASQRWDKLKNLIKKD